jgi:CPA2 family monovalent cation:H+ antiporter-2
VSQLALHALGVRVVSLRRSDGKPVDPDSDLPLEDGDTLVLSGRPDTLAVAQEKLLRG